MTPKPRQMPDPPVVVLNAAIRDVPRPAAINRLPADARGFIVPWFVEWVDGKPDHRIVDGRKFNRAVKEQRCWLCGGHLGRIRASVIGPMCAVSRTTSEPPCHPQCAYYAVQTCPFLTKPRARRNERSLPAERQRPAGLANERNPGVAVVWESLHPSKPFNPTHGAPGTLFTVGAPYRVTWWAEGRPATRHEATMALNSGLPPLLQEAAREGPQAVFELSEAVARACALLPGEAA